MSAQPWGHFHDYHDSDDDDAPAVQRPQRPRQPLQAAPPPPSHPAQQHPTSAWRQASLSLPGLCPATAVASLTLLSDFDDTPRSEVPPVIPQQVARSNGEQSPNPSSLLSSHQDSHLHTPSSWPPPTLEVMTPHASEAAAAASRDPPSLAGPIDYFTSHHVTDDAGSATRFSSIPAPARLLDGAGHASDPDHTDPGKLHHPARAQHQPLLPPPASSPAVLRDITPMHGPTVSTSSATAAGHTVQSRDLASSAKLLSLPPAARPAAQPATSSRSVESTASAATLTSARDLGHRPDFPDQSHAALHSQQHPSPYVPSNRRTGSHPGQVYTFSAAIASRHVGGAGLGSPTSNATHAPRGGEDATAASASPPTLGHTVFGGALTGAIAAAVGVRSGNSSPAAAINTTPATASLGLFQTPAVAPRSQEHVPGTYASPFLHYTHTHMPKETHVADVEKDPVSGRKIINHYEIIDELGRGTHGKVKLGRDLNKHDTHVAIKIVERYSKRRKLGRLGTTEDKVKKEVAILKKARHPNIVALLEVIDDPSLKKVYIVLEWVERGEIAWRVKGPKEIAMVEARRYEREKSGQRDFRSAAEDDAVADEAKRRLAKQARRRLRTFRQMRRETSDTPEAWSLEMAGDSDHAGDSDDDRLSRASTTTTESYPIDSQSQPAQSRSVSRTASHCDTSIIASSSVTARPMTSDTQASLASAAAAAGTPPPTRTHAIEGNFFLGEHFDHHSLYPLSRVSSLPVSQRLSHSQQPQRRRAGSDALRFFAKEVLDSHLDAELEYVPVMTMEQIRIAFRDTLLGLQYLHYQGIVHRDIKPPNLLATIDNRVKISDFGVSYLGRPVHGDQSQEENSEAETQDDFDDAARELAKTVGTPAFYAPELCVMEPTEDPLPVTKAIDVWALGITLFCMLFARTPFVDTEFVVMRQIADEDVYIPRKRLQPVDGKSQSRSSSNSRVLPPQLLVGRRNELDIDYEEIDDDLHDLLTRLLIKDPRQRITLEEVRHHSWVSADLPSRTKWLEETQPSRQSHGQKIQVSREELSTAVGVVERLKSTLGRIGDKLGLHSKSSHNRLRSHSSMGSLARDAAPSVASSSTSTMSIDGRRQSRGDDAVVNDLRASRDSEQLHLQHHPLSQTVDASPQDGERGQFFDSRPSTNANNSPVNSNYPVTGISAEAILAEQASEESHWVGHHPDHLGIPNSQPNAAETGRSRRFLDLRHGPHSAGSPMSSPGLPSTPVALASPGGSGIGAFLSGTGRRIIRRVRETSAHRTLDRRASRSDRGSVESFDPHAEPSLALSPAMAAGHVNLPTQLEDYYTSVKAAIASGYQIDTPSSSRTQSIATSPDHLHPSYAESGGLSRMSSGSSIGSSNRHPAPGGGKYRRSSSRPEAHVIMGYADEDWKRAGEEPTHRQIQSSVDVSRPASSLSPGPPPALHSQGNPVEFVNPFQHRNVGNTRHESVLREKHDPGSQPQRRSDGQWRAAEVAHPDNTSPRQPTPLPAVIGSSSSDLGSAASMSVSVSKSSFPSALSEASSTNLLSMPVSPPDIAKHQNSSDELSLEASTSRGPSLSGSRIGSPSQTIPRADIGGGLPRDPEPGYRFGRPIESGWPHRPRERRRWEDDSSDSDDGSDALQAENDDEEDDDDIEDVDDDDYDDSSDSDGGLVMSRRKVLARNVSSRALSSEGGPHGTSLSLRSRKSSRSGSSNTMKKIRTTESTGEASIADKPAA